MTCSQASLFLVFMCFFFFFSESPFLPRFKDTKTGCALCRVWGYVTLHFSHDYALFVDFFALHSIMVTQIVFIFVIFVRAKQYQADLKSLFFSGVSLVWRSGIETDTVWGKKTDLSSKHEKAKWHKPLCFHKE